MQKILANRDRIMVHLLKSKLEDEGIDCFIKHQVVSISADTLITTEHPELWVMHDKHYLTANNVIQKELTDDHFSKRDWQCAFCRERIEKQFDVCWQCGTSR